jgi:NAD(P)-dependent dehydrogenase (short-subunit alcohol dehydrogenase family)
VGRATAEALAGRGWRVFGTTRSLSDQTGRVEMLSLDVRDDASVAACVAAVTARGRIFPRHGTV